jgi:hypothetical protein
VRHAALPNALAIIDLQASQGVAPSAWRSSPSTLGVQAGLRIARHSLSGAVPNLFPKYLIVFDLLSVVIGGSIKPRAPVLKITAVSAKIGTVNLIRPSE